MDGFGRSQPLISVHNPDLPAVSPDPEPSHQRQPLEGLVDVHRIGVGLLELELLRSALRGKESGWQTLKVCVTQDGPGVGTLLDVARLDAWIAQAERQYGTVDRLLTQVRRRALLVADGPR